MSTLALLARPTRWAQIVGQGTSLSLLRAVLQHRVNSPIAPTGYIFAGPFGSGKTSAAHLTAKALMCSQDPLGCGSCPSCRTLSTHPDFREVDAASHSGVQQARQLLEDCAEMPLLGSKRVVLVDEAHRLSKEAWDAFLKPLEVLQSSCIFLFATTNAKKIPDTVKSRCCTIPFGLVRSEVICGLLVSVAGQHGVDAELEALQLISRAARGHVRDALTLLGQAAAFGRVTGDIVRALVSNTTELLALELLAHCGAQEIPEALKTLDVLTQTLTPPQVVSLVFGSYSRALFPPSPLTMEEKALMDRVLAGLPDYPVVSGCLLKWSNTHNLPLDALSLLVLELANCVSKAPQQANHLLAPRPACVASESVVITPEVSSGDKPFGTKFKRG